MEDARARYDAICDDLVARHPEVALGQMMGMPAIKVDGKMIGGFWQDCMVFKLTDPGAREGALALTGAVLFDPSGKGRPFREWVQVPAEHAAQWERLAGQALGREP